MHLELMFEKYRDWKLLKVMVENPDHSFYTRELSRDTGVGLGTVNQFLKNIMKDKLVQRKIVGNVHLYSLNNESEIIKQIKILNNILAFEKHRLVEKFLKYDDSILSIILYGSYANGEYDSKSDIDLLLLVKQKKHFSHIIQQLENDLKKVISVQTITISDWKTIKNNDKIFYESLLRNHIVVYGCGLP